MMGIGSDRCLQPDPPDPVLSTRLRFSEKAALSRGLCRFRSKKPEGLPGSVLLGAFLVAGRPRTHCPTANQDLHRETAVVAWSRFFGNAIRRLRPAARLAEFQQRALEIILLDGQTVQIDPAQKPPVHELPGFLHPLLQVNGPDNGFEGIRENRGTRLSFGLLQVFAQLDQPAEALVLGMPGKRFAIDQAGSHLREKPLVFLRESLVEVLRRYEPEYGVTEKLEPLVGKDVRTGLATEDGPMSQGQFVQFRAIDGTPDESL
jgi:hypothetical protein